MLKAPAHVETSRLFLRPPHPDDAAEIFRRYANDEEVTRYLGWPRHHSIAETEGFIAFSGAEWERWPAGPYLIVARDTGVILGSTGLAFETPTRASTGYVLARDAWGHGYATEALRAMVDLAPDVGIQRLHALVHPDHRPSCHVLEKCGFLQEALLPRHGQFPNLAPGVPADVLSFVRLFGRRSGEAGDQE